MNFESCLFSLFCLCFIRFKIVVGCIALADEPIVHYLRIVRCISVTLIFFHCHEVSKEIITRGW